MEKNDFKGLDVSVYYEKLKNGLSVYLIPFENRNNYYVEYATKYGANIVEFISKRTNKKVKMPYGIAHFLEHKCFEQENGEDPFSFYSQSGTDANASTGYEITSYTIEGTKNLEENLDYLFNFVNSPYFTCENVEKEKGIIIEELNMYKDQPENILFVESNKSLFQKHPMRIDIGGSPSSVKKITKDMLEESFDTFYQPSNMFVAIAGNFDKEKVLEVIKNNKKLNSIKYNEKPVIFKVKEPLLVNNKEKELKISNLVIPKFIFSFKSLISEMNSIERYKYLMSFNILLYILFGASSEFKDEMFKNELCTMFYSSSDLLDNLLIIEFIAETQKPYVLKEKVIDCLENRKITKEDVERVKKVKISLEVMDSDTPSRLLNSVISNLIDYDEIIYNKIDLIRSITYEDIIKVRKDILIDNYSFVVGFPKNSK